MKVELMSCEEGIIEEIESGDFTRDEITLTYAFYISSNQKPDFGKINRAIVTRWSVSALNYIKKKAWKIVEGR